MLMQVNIASRDAAVVPAHIDSLGEYAGTYNTVFLPLADGQAPRPIELAIASSKSGEGQSGRSLLSSSLYPPRFPFPPSSFQCLRACLLR
jgi:hypothetical protein